MGDGVTSGYVVFDLEANADRSDPPAHEIIEIGAVAVEGDNEIGHFETLVRPTRQLRQVSRELTGLSDTDLAGAPALHAALADFYRFVAGRPLIAHNGFGYDFRLLDAAAERTGVHPPDAARLDSLELAHLVFPRARRGATVDIDGSRPPQGRSLDELAGFLLDEEPRPLHRALDDARLLHRVLIRLLRETASEEPDRRLQRWVLETTGHPWSGFLSDEPAPPPLEQVVPLVEPPRRADPTGVFDPVAVGAMFGDGGALMGRARRPRTQQIDMATSVAATLAAGGRRMIEAPTGTGKTLAYLAPAIEYARASGETVIIAPHSKVLQDQIMATLEELADELDPFEAVLVKGAANYVSLEALAGELDALVAASQSTERRPGTGGGAAGSGASAEPESSGLETARQHGDDSYGLALAIICGWAARTPTGDWDDLRTGALETSRAEIRRLRLLLRAEASPGPALTPLDDRDFHRRARDGLRRAHVGVLNHALLVTWQEWLDRSKRLILDEAHNLEDAATGALTEEADRQGLLALADALWHPGTRRGTVHRLAGATGWSLRSEQLKALRDAADDLRAKVTAFGEAFVEYVRARTGAGRDHRYATSYGIRPHIDTGHPDYSHPIRTGGELRQALRGVWEVLNLVNLPADLNPPFRRRRLEDEMRHLGRRARDLADTVDKVLWVEDPERWIAIGDIDHTPDGWQWVLRRAPIGVDGRLRAVWESLDAAVLTSATLRVGDGFGHVIQTLGLESVETEALGSPFPWIGENHLVLLADYLPAPRARLMEEFKHSAAAEIPRLLTLTRGRGLVLMTAKARMQFVRDHARRVLDGSGIPLLVQGDDSPAALVERMTAERATSLLALRSFWEGVDVPGEALSLLIIEKIPFDSPADPVVGARMDAMERRGKDPFADYLVPRAALRFAQGVGRLIRTETDRGVTVVLDNRLCRAVPYRDRMLGSLPGPPRRATARRREEAYEHIAAHLGDVSYDDEVRRWLAEVPSADPWGDLAGLEMTPVDLADDSVIEDRLERVRERFGFERWRPGQRETMQRFLRGTDVLAVLPTGSGKSITFQIPALLSPGVTLVVAPLTALMNDQVENLRARGVTPVAAIHSGVGQAEWRDVLRGAEQGRYKLLYVSPERLWSQEFVERLSRIGVARIAVDEAHCISQWGHTFRPEYAAIPEALRRLGGRRPPVLAVTATATPRVRSDIRRALRLDPACGEPVAVSPDRREIRYYVERCADLRDRDLRVAQIVEAYRGRAAIVYAPTHRAASHVAGLLRAAGHAARAYHGGMEQPARQHLEDAFRHGELDVVVATKAFGMGIDKPDIELVVHLEMPATIEEYIQETGRAARGARDGTGPATGTAVLLKTARDCSIHRRIIIGSAPDVTRVREVWNRIHPGRGSYDPEELANGDDETDRESVDVALAVHYLQDVGALERHTNTPWRGRVTVTGDTAAHVGALDETHPGLAARARQFIELLRRSDTDEYRAETWARELERPAPDVAADLFDLNHRDVLGFSVYRHAWVLERPPRHEPDWDAVERMAEQRRAEVESKSEEAKRFAALPALPAVDGGESTRARGPAGSPRCRRRALLEYLGADDHMRWDDPERCGACDGCTGLPRPWDGSHLGREDLLKSLPARTIVLRLVADTSRGTLHYSRRNLARTLLGDGAGPHALPDRLANHPAFGRLAFIGRKGLDEIIDGLIDEGLVDSARGEYEDASYETLRITDAGREFLGDR